MNDPLKCGCCGGTNISAIKDVGSDIDPTGEERQHLNTCMSCGAQQFWVDRWHNFTEHKTHYGKWVKRDGDPLELYFS